jgi:hypothetical protein
MKVIPETCRVVRTKFDIYFFIREDFFLITPDRRPTSRDGKCLDGFWPGKLKMTMQTFISSYFSSGYFKQKLCIACTGYIIVNERISK